jgi:hypothetical protein
MGLFETKVRYVNFPNLDPQLKNRTDIVGESFNRDALKAMSSWPLRDDERYWVALRPEPKNLYDQNAIRVDWVKPDGSGWLTCGHIARDETANWHPVLAATPKGTVWVFPAELMGGRPGEDIGLYFNW